MQRRIPAILLAVFVFGCRSVDVTSRHSGSPPKCEIHGAQMNAEWIRVSSGSIVYTIAYLDVVKQRFPHHGGVILTGEREFNRPFTRRVRDFVCPDCTAAYRGYWKEREN